MGTATEPVDCEATITTPPVITDAATDTTSGNASPAGAATSLPPQNKVSGTFGPTDDQHQAPDSNQSSTNIPPKEPKERAPGGGNSNSTTTIDAPSADSPVALVVGILFLLLFLLTVAAICYTQRETIREKMATQHKAAPGVAGATELGHVEGKNNPAHDPSSSNYDAVAAAEAVPDDSVYTNADADADASPQRRDPTEVQTTCGGSGVGGEGGEGGEAYDVLEDSTYSGHVETPAPAGAKPGDALPPPPLPPDNDNDNDNDTAPLDDGAYEMPTAKAPAGKGAPQQDSGAAATVQAEEAFDGFPDEGPAPDATAVAADSGADHDGYINVAKHEEGASGLSL